MKLLEEYESRAEQWRKLADKAEASHREAILNICKTWRRLAHERRRGSLVLESDSDWR